MVTQTTDGYLWIGTNLGLVRFDGVHFAQWNPPDGERLLDSRIFSLQGAHDGSLWIGTGYGISHWKDGELTNYPQLSGRIESIVEDAEGAIWLVRTQVTDGMGPLCRIKDGQLKCYGADAGIPFPSAIQLGKGNSGDLWVGGYSELLSLESWIVHRLFCEYASAARNVCFLKSDRQHNQWAGLGGNRPALARVCDWSISKTGAGPLAPFPGIAVNNSDVTTLFVDREDSLWMGTEHHGIFRIRGNDVDHFGNKDGLSSDAVGRFYQDAEGTLWIVTSEGIDNFRDLQVASYSMREGLAAAGASTVLAARDGTVWVGNSQALDFMRNGKLSAIRPGQGLPGRNVTTIFEDHAGRLWVGVDAGLWVYDRGVFQEVRHADGTSLGIVFAITEDVHHNIWVRAGPNLDSDSRHETRGRGHLSANLNCLYAGRQSARRSISRAGQWRFGSISGRQDANRSLQRGWKYPPDPRSAGGIGWLGVGHDPG